MTAPAPADPQPAVEAPVGGLPASAAPDEHPAAQAGNAALARLTVELTEVAPAAPAGRGALDGARVLVVHGGGDDGLAGAELPGALAARLAERGAQVTGGPGAGQGPDAVAAVAEALATGAGADGVVWLVPASPGGADDLLPGAFELVRALALGGASQLLLASAAAPLGLPGLARALDRELAGRVRLVDLASATDEPVAALAARLVAELVDGTGPSTVRHRDGQRLTPTPVPLAALPGAGPSPDLARLAAALRAGGLGRDSVVLATGGARGITARVALALAEATGCALELVGRSPAPPGPEDPLTAGAADARSLRRVLAESGLSRPSQIEPRIRQVLAEREIRAALDGLAGKAASVRYHAVDVRDAAALRAVIDDIYARHGRLDGVIHGAGVLDDRLLRDKTADAFARVYDTKVAAARAIAAAVRDDLRFLVLFGSVAGVFGNRGQSDYAAANDALDALAHAWAARFAPHGGRVVAIDWGPWRGGGMVSPELEREYARRGIGLIDPAAGVAACLAEIARALTPGDADPADAPTQVVYLAGDPGAFGA
ncbi:MAG: SDR family NAD(P)-dependent oxidoreductase [Frankia sp.]|nr:SDR family NAD(P)-dependent oxidoreductase [Frankia sp.]